MELKQKLIDLEKRMSTVEQTVGIKPLRTEDTYIPGYSEPKHGEKYYTFITEQPANVIVIYPGYWSGSEEDQLALLAGWVFRIKGEAEDKLKCMKAYSEYIKAIQIENKRTGFVPDFTGIQDNWSFGYQYNTGEYITYQDFNYSSLPEYLYMERNSLNIVEKELGKEKIIKALRN